jgi:hypothetical protein
MGAKPVRNLCACGRKRRLFRHHWPNNPQPEQMGAEPVRTLCACGGKRCFLRQRRVYLGTTAIQLHTSNLLHFARRKHPAPAAAPVLCRKFSTCSRYCPSNITTGYGQSKVRGSRRPEQAP